MTSTGEMTISASTVAEAGTYQLLLQGDLADPFTTTKTTPFTIYVISIVTQPLNNLKFSKLEPSNLVETISPWSYQPNTGGNMGSYTLPLSLQ